MVLLCSIRGNENGLGKR
ncbi:hypothetical protein OK744_08970 [Streptococcus pneumoniae]|nr:hypothetical protein [Streptococcus pneumoniae]